MSRVSALRKIPGGVGGKITAVSSNRRSRMPLVTVCPVRCDHSRAKCAEATAGPLTDGTGQPPAIRLSITALTGPSSASFIELTSRP